MSTLVPILLGLVIACGDRDEDTAGDDTGPTAADGGSPADGGTPGDGGSPTDGGSPGDGGTTDGGTDCPDPQVWLYDADGDGYGDDDLSLEACEQPAGYVSIGGDCDDISPLVHPGGAESCGNGLDEDCDGSDSSCPLPDSGDLSTVAFRFTTTTSSDDLRQPVALGDVDGDGVADLVLGVPEADGYGGRAELFLGPVGAGRDTPDHQVTPAVVSADLAAIGAAVLAPGDLDGDGIGDLVVASPMAVVEGDGGAWLLPGPVADVGLNTSELVYAPTGEAGLGMSLAAAADLTGDGHPDLVVGACCDGHSPGYVLPGPVSPGRASDLGYALTPAGSARQSFHAVATGDVDGDGVSDLAVGEGTPDSGPEEGRVYLLDGPITGDRALLDADTRLRSTESEDLFGWAAALGDLDGDGLDDLVAGAPIREDGGEILGMVTILLAPAGRGIVPDTAADATLLGTATNPIVGTSIVVSDLDGDGDAELLLGAPGIDLLTGGLLVVQDFAAMGGTLAAPDRRWTATAADGWVGMWAVGGADATGDGRDDVVVAGLTDSSPGEAWLVAVTDP